MRFLNAPVGGDLLGVRADDAEQLATGRLSDRKLASVRRALLALLDDVAAPRPGRSRPWPSRAWSLSLRLAAYSRARVRRQAAKPWEKAPRLTAAERRAYLGPGAYVLSVSGTLRDVLLYSVMRLLTEPGAVALARCPARSADDHSRQCGRWLVAIGKRRGRPAIYCSDLCRVRAWKKANR
jgi:hypothetical protein